jgi:outer membrane protein assembly factor BamA
MMKSGLRRILSLIVLAVLVAAARSVYAQASSQSDESTVAPGPETGVIADKPALHSTKRALHPLSWIGASARPLIRMMSGVRSPNDSNRPDPATFRIAVDQLGGGSGIGPKVELSHTFKSSGIRMEADAVYTYKRYEGYELEVTAPIIATDELNRLALKLETGYQSRPSDSFFGLGNDSPYGERSRYRSVHRDIGLALTSAISPTLSAEIGVTQQNIGITRPLRASLRSAQQAFQGANVPGLAEGAKLRSVVAVIRHNTKDSQNAPKRGGLRSAEVSVNRGYGGSDAAYWKYQLELQQYIPLFADGRSVIAARVLAETNQEKGGRAIPLIAMPYVGGRTTLRAFQSRRFVDKSALGATVEYRYRIWQVLDAGLFVDKGQVAAEPGDFDVHRFHTGYGVRLIARPSPKHVFAVDAAHSKEGWQFYASYNPDF